MIFSISPDKIGKGANKKKFQKDWNADYEYVKKDPNCK